MCYFFPIIKYTFLIDLVNQVDVMKKRSKAVDVLFVDAPTVLEGPCFVK